jgi:hypothetical protein
VWQKAARFLEGPLLTRLRGSEALKDPNSGAIALRDVVDISNASLQNVRIIPDGKQLESDDKRLLCI